MNWIQKVVNAHRENEAPEYFFYWAAVTALSAVVKKNVFMERYFYKLYPNIYVFIVAKSGMKKGVPVALAKKMVEKANCTRVISGRNSVQSIVQTLGKASIEGGGVIDKAQALIVSGELAALLVRDPAGLTILTDLHNTHEYEKEWVNTLKGEGGHGVVDRLRSPCITLLGATNEDHFVDAVPQVDVKGGFIARTFIVHSNERGTPNPLTEKPTTLIDIDDLSLYLKEAAQVRGEFQWSAAAKIYYDAWYRDMMAHFPDESTGTFGRIGDQVVKLAMLISLSKNFDLIITEEDVIEAKVSAYRCADGMRQVTMGAGSSSYTAQTKLVLKALIASPDNRIDRKKLLSRYWGDLDAPTLDIVIETLLGGDIIAVYRQGANCVYEMKKKALEEYIQFTKRIQ